MAFIARCAKRAVVDIIVAVTTVTGFGRHNLFGVQLGMTGVAGGHGVFSGQWIVRLRCVVIAPLLPIGSVVTILALGPQPPQMHVFLAMATNAIFRRFLVVFCGVAAAAFGCCVLVEQREFRILIVVEQNTDGPSALVVTALTRLAEPALMDVILAVTRHTRCGELFELRIFLVTAFAFGGQMLAKQRKLRIAVVVKSDLFPRPGRVARFAPLAILTIVFVLLAVTRVALLRNSSPTLANMAGCTGGLSVGSGQLEIGDVVVEVLGGAPGFSIVTGFAFFTEAGLVRVSSLVAIDALRWGFAEFLSGKMAAVAFDEDVGASQCKIGTGVVEG